MVGNNPPYDPYEDKMKGTLKAMLTLADEIDVRVEAIRALVANIPMTPGRGCSRCGESTVEGTQP